MVDWNDDETKDNNVNENLKENVEKTELSS